MPTQSIIDGAAALLADLIALPTVNPMGRPRDSDVPVERPVIECLERIFSPYGVPVQRQRCSPIHESLVITLPGSTDLDGTLLESHIDTVPADDWHDRAFRPRREADVVYGRGACDDKGSLAAMVLALLDILRSGRRPRRTAWLLAAGDEEHAQTGIRHFMGAHQAPIGRAVVGEPTEGLPVVQHKGILRWDITLRGRSAHTSRPELGRNAILDMMRVCDCLQHHQQLLQSRFTNPLMSGPTIAVTMIHGGQTRNMIPDQCTVAVDFRILPGMDLQGSADELFAALAALGVPISHSEFQCFVPPLSTPINDPFVQDAISICRDQWRRDVAPAGVPYGSDAAWIPRSIPTVVLGPGDIAKAHAVDECVGLRQIVGCAEIYKQIILLA